MIEGVRRNLSTRKYCLSCSPRGEHNTKRIHEQPPEGTKQCLGGCGNLLPLNSFYEHKNGQFHSYCRSCDRQRQKNKYQTLKSQAVVYKGGKCMVCEYNRSTAALDFHHLDPDKKDFTLSTRKGTFDAAFRAELDKCVLLCSNCHREVHAGVLILSQV